MTGTASLETRWFAREPYPDALTRYFDVGAGGAEGLVTVERRTDRYLKACREELGVKLRGGRLEIKLRERDLGVKTFAPRVNGRCAAWRKWSIPVPDDGARAIADSDSDWVAVEKLRRFARLDRAGLRTSPNGQPSAGCNFELTEVSVAGRVWWSVGFEAFGDETELESILVSAVRRLSDHVAELRLDATTSCDYPEFLMRAVRGGRDSNPPVSLDRRAP
jgi:hypothetical protein